MAQVKGELVYYSLTSTKSPYKNGPCGGKTWGRFEINDDEHMLSQIWLMMSNEPRTCSKQEIIQTFEECIEEYNTNNRFHDTQILFKKIVDNIDRLLNIGVKDGAFAVTS